MDKHLFAPAAILLTAVALAACGNDSDKTAEPTTTVPAAVESATTNPTRTPATTASTAAPASRASSYALLWPFTTEQAARTWMEDAAPGGHQPWRLDAELTALSFARDFLGYQGISRVSSTSIKADDAEIGVGFASDEVVGGLATAAVVHLIRIGGTGADADPGDSGDRLVPYVDHLDPPGGLGHDQVEAGGAPGCGQHVTGPFVCDGQRHAGRSPRLVDGHSDPDRPHAVDPQPRRRRQSLPSGGRGR